MADMVMRGKIVAVSSVLTGLMVLVGAGLSAWPRLEEEWWLHRLRNEDEGERRHAAKRLGALGSVRAVPELVAAMRPAIAARSQEIYIGSPEGILGGDVAYYQALVRIGQPALPGLIRALAEDACVEGFFGGLIVSLAIDDILGGLRKHPTLGLPAPDKGPLTPVNLLHLVAKEDAVSQETRDAAAAALGRIPRADDPRGDSPQWRGGEDQHRDEPDAH